jgi:hypothetical protein
MASTASPPRRCRIPNSQVAARVGALRLTAGMDSSPGLTDLIINRLADADLSTEAASLVFAAVLGDGDLDDALGSLTGSAAVPRAHSPTPEHLRAARDSGEVFLRSLSVTAFRGIGPAATLELTPGPGLTVVAGRNGSGKSSFAEAAELALTGAVARWTNARTASAGWRNIHADAPTEIIIELATAGVPQPTTVRRAWPGDDLSVGSATSQVHSRPRAGLDALGWAESLVTYRPFLSSTELASLDDKPSRMFDALQAILGLDELTMAAARLKRVAQDLDDQGGRAKRDLPQVQTVLARLSDPRADHAEALLATSAARRDLSAISALATGAASDPDADRLAALATLDDPPDQITALAADLRAAAVRREAFAGSAADDARRTGALLTAALDHHDRHGEDRCPVCRTGTLDAAWRVEATERRDHCVALAQDVDLADRAVHDAAAALRARIPAVAPVLRGAPIAHLPVEQVRTAWSDWVAATTNRDPLALAHAAAAGLPVVTAAVTALRDAARAEQQRRDTGWSEVAETLAAWVAAARTEADLAPARNAVKAATAWLRDAGDQLRDDRLRPFAEQSARIWAQLRQESNIELGSIRLEGTATRRRLTLDATVDGSDAASAIAVLSQGEFNALGLALFLPRACADASPFRFVVLDDPVQAMDPAKVDGLARVLTDLAATRQVVVFSHDDRLPESLRRLGLPARVVEVVRSLASKVDVRELTDPAAAHLNDARALARTDDLPDDMRRIGIAGCCRDALEAACLDLVRRRRIGAGVRSEDVDRVWGATTTTMRRTALAMFDDAESADKVYARLNRMGTWATPCLKHLKEGAHIAGDVTDLVRDTEKLIRELGRS